MVLTPCSRLFMGVSAELDIIFFKNEGFCSEMLKDIGGRIIFNGPLRNIMGGCGLDSFGSG